MEESDLNTDDEYWLEFMLEIKMLLFILLSFLAHLKICYVILVYAP